MQRRLVKNLEDLCLQYDMTVRNSVGDVVQFCYGGDAMDPTYMEGNDCPVDFKRVLDDVKSRELCKDEVPWDGYTVLMATRVLLESEDYRNLDGEFKKELLEFLGGVAERIDFFRRDM